MIIWIELPLTLSIMASRTTLDLLALLCHLLAFTLCPSDSSIGHVRDQFVISLDRDRTDGEQPAERVSVLRAAAFFS